MRPQCTSSRSKGVKKKRYALEAMQGAYEAVRAGKMSQKKAAKHYGIPRTTLVGKLNGKLPVIAPPRTVLTKDEEDKLVDCLITMDRSTMKNSQKNVEYTDDDLKLAYEAVKSVCLNQKDKDVICSMAKQITLERPDQSQPTFLNNPGRGWLRGFLKRHPSIKIHDKRTYSRDEKPGSQTCETTISTPDKATQELLIAQQKEEVLKLMSSSYSVPISQYYEATHQKTPENIMLEAGQQTRVFDNLTVVVGDPSGEHTPLVVEKTEDVETIEYADDIVDDFSYWDQDNTNLTPTWSHPCDHRMLAYNIDRLCDHVVNLSPMSLFFCRMEMYRGNLPGPEDHLYSDYLRLYTKVAPPPERKNLSNKDIEFLCHLDCLCNHVTTMSKIGLQQCRTKMYSNIPPKPEEHVYSQYLSSYTKIAPPPTSDNLSENELCKGDYSESQLQFEKEYIALDDTWTRYFDKNGERQSSLNKTELKDSEQNGETEITELRNNTRRGRGRKRKETGDMKLTQKIIYKSI